MAVGRLTGGNLSLVQQTIGTPYEIDTRGAILFLEDRGLKPYQLDRLLLHLLQAGKFRGVRGIVLGDFPDCEPLAPSTAHGTAHAPASTAALALHPRTGSHHTSGADARSRLLGAAHAPAPVARCAGMA